MRALLYGAAGASICLGGTAGACSPAPFSAFRLRNAVSFIGVASADTVLAGSGAGTFTSERGKEPRSAVAIFGQVIRVERLGAATPTLPLALQRRGALDVVLVPWGLGSDCTPMPWTASARWVAPLTRGFYAGALRDRAFWVGGRPTLDVSAPYVVPYTGIAQARAPRGGSAALATVDTLLTPDELLNLRDKLPLKQETSASEAALRARAAPLFRWAHDNPRLAKRYPATEVLQYLRWSMAEARLRGIRSPLAGTYRFVLTLPHGDSVVFHARTESHVMGGMDVVDAGESPTLAPEGTTQWVGYYVLAEAARAAQELDRRSPRSTEVMQSQGYLGMVEKPVVSTRDSTVWRGDVDLLRVLKGIVAEPRVRVALDCLVQNVDAQIRAHTLSFAPGRFTLGRDGRMRYDVSVDDHGVPVFRLSGARISTKVLSTQH